MRSFQTRFREQQRKLAELAESVKPAIDTEVVATQVDDEEKSE